MVSIAWSQRRHLGWCCRPRRCRRAAVQQRSLLANQWKILTRGGAQLFQMNFQALQAVEPWKVAL